MSKEHLNLDRLTAYFLNRMTSEEETSVQEHLRQCPECSRKLSELRALYDAFYNEKAEVRLPVFKRIIKSGWTKAAASVIIIFGAGFLIYKSIMTRQNVMEQQIINGGKEIENLVFALDTFSKEDSIYYFEKYGEDFGK